MKGLILFLLAFIKENLKPDTLFYLLKTLSKLTPIASNVLTFKLTNPLLFSSCRAMIGAQKTLVPPKISLAYICHP